MAVGTAADDRIEHHAVEKERNPASLQLPALPKGGDADVKEGLASTRTQAECKKEDVAKESERHVDFGYLSELVISTASPAMSEAGESGESSNSSVTQDAQGNVDCHSNGLMPFADLAGARRSAPEASQKAHAHVELATALSPGSAPCCCGGLQYLQEMLNYMDSYCQGMRPWQQQWVSLVESACRTALESNYKEMALVGSLALALETPGSDVDLVCVTHSPAHQVDAVTVLRKVRDILVSDSHSTGFPDGFTVLVIDDARIPILSVTTGSHVLVDLALNSHHSIQHVSWFRNVGAVPPNPPTVVQVPVLTVTLRCLKWWLRMRRIPRMKDGSLPTVAWMLLAMHVCAEQSGSFSPELLSENPLAAVLALLSAFFQRYTTVSGLDGKLQFEKGSAVSSFQQSFQKRPCHADLVILDPESDVNLAPPMSPATHILLVHELLRARSLLKSVMSTGQCQHLHSVFQPVPELVNSLPASASDSFDALVFLGGNGDSSCTVELVRIHSIRKMPWWQAPFLARWDMQSHLEAHIFCEQQVAGRCTFVQTKAITLSPWNFICRVETTGDEKQGLILDDEALHCMKSMKALASEMQGWAAIKSR